MNENAIAQAMIIPGMMWPTELHSLANLFRLSSAHLEIGCFCGKSLYATAAGMSNNPEAEVWAIDNFCSTDFAPSRGWCLSVLQATLASIESELGVRTKFLLGNSLDHVGELRNMQLDSVFIDSNHTFEDVCRESCAVWPMLRIRGYLAGHDFADNFIAVKDAVHAMFADSFTVLPNSRIWVVQKTEITDKLIQRFAARN